MTFQEVGGTATKKGRIVLYALSTCMWCRMAKQLLNELGVAYSFVDVDRLEAEEKALAKEEVRRWNPEGTYPTIVVDGKETIRGYDEAEIREKVL